MDCLKSRHEVKITRTPWVAAPFLPIPDATYPKKNTTVSYQNPTLQTPSSPKHPGTDTGEDPHHQKPSEITVEQYAPCRRLYGVDRGQPLTDLSPDTIPHICSPFLTLSESCPPPFKFAQEPCFFFSSLFISVHRSLKKHQ